MDAAMAIDEARRAVAAAWGAMLEREHPEFTFTITDGPGGEVLYGPPRTVPSRQRKES